jgi:predicted transcriptional regulator
METKLTLRLEDKLIRKAKKLAKARGKSVSQMVADYIVALEAEPKPAGDLPPITKSLQGSLKGKNVDEKDYKKYLGDKYL